LAITVHASQVKDRLRHILLENIANERSGQLIERMLMRNTLSMLAELGVDGPSVYEEDFEQYFLETTRDFYRYVYMYILSGIARRSMV